nr:IS3 family transposase [Priestia aryabhattai]MDH3115432.1 IS3 family transposase [Priestia aryabhattai]MDH3125648.1 IS3 family transposase [Priestia aryabhattai]MDH3125674.1 IS3 family transposase [Priestia aryabhattai]
MLRKVRSIDVYMSIQELHQNEKYPILLLCQIAKVSRSAYYKWLKRTPSTNEKLNEEIVEEVKQLHEELGGIYGYRRMTLKINRRFKQPINHKRVYRLMKLFGIQSVIRRKRTRYKPSSPKHITENVLNREFHAKKPNEKWLTDVTELSYGRSEKAYLSAILDLYDGSIVSYVLGTSNNNPLVFKTFEQALKREPGATPLLHSDRGYQYTSPYFKKKLEEAKVVQSMSRVGRCIDNGPMESFWGTLKCEKYYLKKYKTYEELEKEIKEYIYFYNNERLQKRLNGLSPLEYRAEAV